MRIVLFHPVLLPPRDYGGVERVVQWLAQGLLERGHEVHIAALAGSILPLGCHLIEVDRRSFSAVELMKILPKGVDLIHFMAPVSEEIWDNLFVPKLLTVHGNGKLGEKFPKNSVFLSDSHARLHGASCFIYNGINPDEYLFSPDQKKSWYLFLSKTHWRVKNLSGTMKFCRKAKVSLKIAGGSRPFFNRMMCWFQPHFEWIGPVSGVKKAYYLAHAKALLFPVRWPEPFGLVIAEALISGTPVVGFPRGSLVELIPPEVGVLLESEDEWIRLLEEGTLLADPERCRQWALEKFHYRGMAENYERIYQQIFQGRILHEVYPRGLGWNLM